MEHTFIWLLTQRQNKGFDTFDSCLVAADTEDEARMITPDGLPFRGILDFPRTRAHSRWAYTSDAVVIEKIGVTKRERKGKVIITSYNAG